MEVTWMEHVLLFGSAARVVLRIGCVTRMDGQWTG